MLLLTQQKKLKHLLQSRNGHFDSSEILMLNSLPLREGKLVFYYTENPFKLGVALLDNQIETVIWRTTNPLWETQDKILPKQVSIKNSIIQFTYTFEKISASISFLLPDVLALSKQTTLVTLTRVNKNPILKPNPHQSWESTAVYNSGALYLDNQVHFVYRALMSTGESVLGYAASKDGVHIHERSTQPIYSAHDAEKFVKNGYLAHYLPYQSGNSWCGCEDPRLTHISDTIYMTYTAWDTVSPPYVALTSIKVTDFLKQIWNWKKPIRLSPIHETHKNWVMFPEKINGRYAILHSITPKIAIDYLDTFNDKQTCINSHYHPEKRSEYWDNRMRGAGPPPIKTSEGWLLLYHAMDCNDPNRYKIGAMILDLKNPTKVLYRSSHPILEPDARYENHGHKSGVIYACGAVVIDEDLFVYYGGADTVLCAAHHNLNNLLASIKNTPVAS